MAFGISTFIDAETYFHFPGTIKEEDRRHILKLFDDITVTINKEDVFRLLGRRNGSSPGRTAKRLDRFVGRAKSLVEPRVLYSTRKIAGVDKCTVTLEGGIALKSSKLSKTLGSCDSATVFLATIGTDIDCIIKELSGENKLSDAYIYDAIGSVAVEGTVNYFQNRIDVSLSDSRKSTTMRFSPGYCDWNIKEQAKIFDLLDGEEAGVSLSPNFIMNPRKSVSGVFGIRPGPAETRPNPCTLCSKKSCIARR